MDYTQISIIKRDGKTEPFSLDKIVRAITKAFRAGGITDEGQAVEQIASDVAAAITKAEISVEEIQDMVEERLMKRNPSIAKRYIIYREGRNVERDRRSSIKSVMDGIVTVEKNDINLSNANMSSHTPAGQMMTFASEITKDYALKYLVGVRHGRAHRDGDIHIHDLDYYPTKTTTCIQYDLGDIYERGFSTKNGSVRTPQSIQSYATLATIVFQTNQNEQHGGQSIPAFDHFMAPGVLKTFRRHLTDMTLFLCGVRGGVTLERAELKAWSPNTCRRSNPARRRWGVCSPPCASRAWRSPMRTSDASGGRPTTRHAARPIRRWRDSSTTSIRCTRAAATRWCSAR